MEKFSEEFKNVLNAIKNDNNLNEAAKKEFIRKANELYNDIRIERDNSKKRRCKKCLDEYFFEFCDYCIRKHLEKDSWTSGNENIDRLIRNYQKNVFRPDYVLEWIPYNHFRNIQLITEGGFSKIYKATWTKGRFQSWDSEQQKLKRSGSHTVNIKRTKNPNDQWFEEVLYLLVILSIFVDLYFSNY